VFENRVLRRIFGPKREEVAGDWRRQHNEELHNFYASLNIIRVIKSRRMKWVGHVPRMGEMRHEGRIPFARPSRRWEDNIRMDLKEIGWEGVNWIHLVHDRDTVMNLGVP
jgi:hypothetical protein